jgi:hypothetical protein
MTPSLAVTFLVAAVSVLVWEGLVAVSAWQAARRRRATLVASLIANSVRHADAAPWHVSLAYVGGPLDGRTERLPPMSATAALSMLGYVAIARGWRYVVREPLIAFEARTLKLTLEGYVLVTRTVLEPSR